MQKSRCRRGLEFDLLSLSVSFSVSLGLLVGCASQPAAAAAPALPTPATSVNAPASAPSAPVNASGAPAPATTAAPDSDASPPPQATTAAPVNAAATASPALPKGTLVLHIGDSFAAALGVELGKRLKSEGVRNALEYKTASYIPNWSFGGDIPKFIANYRPDLVLVTLGANEIEIPKPEQRVGAIRHLVAELGGRPCVWIAPPLWKPDTGLLKVIQDNVAPCRYLDSNALVHDLPRGRDKIHPSPEGRAIWADIVFHWLVQERVGSDSQPWALKPAPSAAASPH
jgi:lysophospholipase L1-like esterase